MLGQSRTQPSTDDAGAAAALEVGGEHFADAAGIAAGKGLDYEHVTVFDGLEDCPERAALFGTFLGGARKDVLSLGHESERYGRADNFGSGCAGQWALDKGMPDAETVHGGAGGGSADSLQLFDEFRLGAGNGAAVNGQGHAGRRDFDSRVVVGGSAHRAGSSDG